MPGAHVLYKASRYEREWIDRQLLKAGALTDHHDPSMWRTTVSVPRSATSSKSAAACFNRHYERPRHQGDVRAIRESWNISLFRPIDHRAQTAVVIV